MGRLDDMSAAWFMRASKALEKVDASNALQIQALVHKSRSEEQSCIAKYQGAVNADLSNITMWGNFGRTLMYFCRIDEARKVLEDGYRRSGENDEISILLISALCSSLMFKSASKVRESSEKLMKLRLISEDIGLTEDVGAAYSAQVATLFKKSGAFLSGSTADINDDDDSSIVIKYSLNAAPETVADLEFKAFGIGVDEGIPGFAEGRMGIECRAVSESESHLLEF